MFDVSRITIMRDLKTLQESNLIQKIHGGAKLSDSFAGIEQRFNIRIRINYDLKRQIACKAIEYFNSNGTFFLDSSTTSYIIARELLNHPLKNVTIITNSVPLLNLFAENPQFRVISTGGELDPEYNMLSGIVTSLFLNNVNIDAAFISCGGISVNFNLTTSNPNLADMLRKLIQQTGEINLIADSTKIFKPELINVAKLNKCTRLITDSNLPDPTYQTLLSSGIPIIR